LSQLLSKKSRLTVLHQMFNVSALLLDVASKTATPMTNGAINQIPTWVRGLTFHKVV